MADSLRRVAMRPGSPQSMTTTQSRDFQREEGSLRPRIVVSRKDLVQSMKAYETLLASAKAYRNALLALASASGSFAVALEDCARQKGAAGVDNEPGYSASERLMAAAGLHHIASNQNHVLADSLYKSFEIPLLEQLDEHKNAVAERQAAYEKQVAAKTKQIRETEAANMKHGRKKMRDLGAFRKALTSLQNQVDELDRLKFTYYSELLDGQAETWEDIASKTATVVHAEHQLYDRVASKATSDPILEVMVQSVLDPFGEFLRPEDVEPGIFSILQPMAIPAALPRVASPPPVLPSQQITPTLNRSRVVSGPDDSFHTSPETPRHAWADVERPSHPRANGSDSTVSPGDQSLPEKAEEAT